MKTAIFKYSLLAGAMVFCGLAMANPPSATLLVKGQVSTGTCTAVLATPNINLGTTSTDKIPATGGYRVKADVPTALNINCTSPLKYQISITDNRSGSAVSGTDLGLSSSYDSLLMGLGTTTDGKKIGGYMVASYLITSAVNGSTVITPSRIRKSITPGADWVITDDSGAGAYGVYYMTPLNYSAGKPGTTSYVAIAKSGEDEPAATTAATIVFSSDYFLSSGLQSITDQAQIDGSVTFNLDYL